MPTQQIGTPVPQTEPLPPAPRGRADVRPEDGAQVVPQDPGSIVESEISDQEWEVTDGHRR